MAKKDEKSMSFEEAMAQLEKIVEQISAGKIGLEESLERYEQGMELVKKCRAILERSEKRIDILSESGSKLQASPMEQLGENDAD